MINHIRYLEIIHIHLSFDYLPGFHNLLVNMDFQPFFPPTIHSVNWWSRWWTWTTKTRTGGSIHVIPMISQDISDEILHPPKRKTWHLQCTVFHCQQFPAAGLLPCSTHPKVPTAPNGTPTPRALKVLQRLSLRPAWPKVGGIMGISFSDLPSSNLLHSYWKWPFIVDLPIKNGDFP